MRKASSERCSVYRCNSSRSPIIPYLSVPRGQKPDSVLTLGQRFSRSSRTQHSFCRNRSTGFVTLPPTCWREQGKKAESESSSCFATLSDAILSGWERDLGLIRGHANHHRGAAYGTEQVLVGHC